MQKSMEDLLNWASEECSRTAKIEPDSRTIAMVLGANLAGEIIVAGYSLGGWLSKLMLTLALNADGYITVKESLFYMTKVNPIEASRVATYSELPKSAIEVVPNAWMFLIGFGIVMTALIFALLVMYGLKNELIARGESPESCWIMVVVGALTCFVIFALIFLPCISMASESIVDDGLRIMVALLMMVVSILSVNVSYKSRTCN